MIYGMTNKEQKEAKEVENWFNHLGVTKFAFFPTKLQDGRKVWLGWYVDGGTWLDPDSGIFWNSESSSYLFTESQWRESRNLKIAHYNVYKHAPDRIKKMMKEVFGDVWYGLFIEHASNPYK